MTAIFSRSRETLRSDALRSLWFFTVFDESAKGEGMGRFRLAGESMC